MYVISCMYITSLYMYCKLRKIYIRGEHAIFFLIMLSLCTLFKQPLRALVIIWKEKEAEVPTFALSTVVIIMKDKEAKVPTSNQVLANIVL